MALLLIGCASGGPATDFCLNYQPVFVSKLDQLTDLTARGILINNEFYADHCMGRGR